MPRRRATAFFVAIAILLPLAVAAFRSMAAKPTPPRTMAISDVPAAFMETARKELPDVAFDEAWVKKNGTLEIRGKAKNGKVREIEIRPDGSIEEIE